MFRKNFDRLERWFHWLALEPLAVRRLAFDLECAFALPEMRVDPDASPAGTAGPADGAVYVCGLARSGTTVLLRALHECDALHSLTYRDMPFVLAPNLWRRVAGHATADVAPEERAHGDGIVVDVDSPEAFEEVFWRTFTRRTSDTRCFGTEPPSAEALVAFARYRAVVANPRAGRAAAGARRRYLSKNNNNLLRLDALGADPTATLLVAYRHPVDTARSLFRQHERFLALQTEDRFTYDYMRWLSHHEFGLGHLPFCFAVAAMDRSLTPDDPNYWLDYWNAVHAHALAGQQPRRHLVDHDTLRERPAEVLHAIFSILGERADIDRLAAGIKPAASVDRDPREFRPDLLERSAAIHRALRESAQNVCGPAWEAA